MRRAAAAAAWAAIACQAQLLVPTNGSARRSVPKCKNEGPTTWRCSNWRGVLPQLCRWPEVPPLRCAGKKTPFLVLMQSETVGSTWLQELLDSRADVVAVGEQLQGCDPRMIEAWWRAATARGRHPARVRPAPSRLRRHLARLEGAPPGRPLLLQRRQLEPAHGAATRLPLRRLLEPAHGAPPGRLPPARGGNRGGGASCGAAGFKVKLGVLTGAHGDSARVCGDACADRLPAVLRALANLGGRLVCLYRENPVRHAISAVRQRQQLAHCGEMASRVGEDGARCRAVVQGLNVSLVDLAAALDRAKKSRQALLAACEPRRERESGRNGTPPLLLLSYEALSHDASAALRRVHHFLGVSEAPPLDLAAPTIVKMTNHNLRVALPNFDEVHAWVEARGFRLDDDEGSAAS